jgi:hypothetical protein
VPNHPLKKKKINTIPITINTMKLSQSTKYALMKIRHIKINFTQMPNSSRKFKKINTMKRISSQILKINVINNNTAPQKTFRETLKKSQTIEKNINLSESFEQNPLIEKFEKEHKVKKETKVAIPA